MTATKVPKEKIIDKIDTAIYKLPNSPKIELGDTLTECSKHRGRGYFSG